MDFSKNGNYIASGSSDSSVIVWDISNGSKINIFKNLGGKIISIAFNQNDESIIAGTNNGKLVVLNVVSGKIEYSYSFANTKITDIGFTKEKNKMLVSISVQNSSNSDAETNSVGSLYLFDFYNFNKPIAINTKNAILPYEETFE